MNFLVWKCLNFDNQLKFVHKGPINNIPALVQIMAWCRPGDKPLSEPMLVSLLTCTCITRPQWVKQASCQLYSVPQCCCTQFFVHREDKIDLISSHLTLSYVILSYLPILLLHYRPLFLAKQNEGVGRLLGHDDISCRFGTGFDLDPLDVGGYRRRGERLDIDWLCLDERLVNGSGWGWGHPRPVRTGLLERNDIPMA